MEDASDNPKNIVPEFGWTSASSSEKCNKLPESRKMRNRQTMHYSSKQREDEMEEPLDLPLPISTLPTFSIDLIKNPPVKANEKKMSSSFSTPPKVSGAKSHKSASDGDDLVFSSPLPVSVSEPVGKLPKPLGVSTSVAQKSNFTLKAGMAAPATKPLKQKEKGFDDGPPGVLGPAKELKTAGSVMDFFKKSTFNKESNEFGGEQFKEQTQKLKDQNLELKEQNLELKEQNLELKEQNLELKEKLKELILELKELSQKLKTWACPKCSIDNPDSETNCASCDTSKPGSLPKPILNFGDKFKPPSNKWECAICCVFNEPTITKCIACGEAKSTPTPSTVAKPAVTPSNLFGDKFKMKFGNWECDTCMVTNKPEDNTCIACTTPRPGESKEDEIKWMDKQVEKTEKQTGFGIPAVRREETMSVFGGPIRNQMTEETPTLWFATPKPVEQISFMAPKSPEAKAVEKHKRDDDEDEAEPKKTMTSMEATLSFSSLSPSSSQTFIPLSTATNTNTVMPFLEALEATPASTAPSTSTVNFGIKSTIASTTSTSCFLTPALTSTATPTMPIFGQQTIAATTTAAVTTSTATTSPTAGFFFQPVSTTTSTFPWLFGGSSTTLTTTPAFGLMTTSAGFSGTKTTNSIFAPTSSASVLQPPSSTQSFFGYAASQQTFTANTTAEAKSTLSTFTVRQNSTTNTIPQFGSSGSIMSGTRAGSGIAVTPAPTPASTSTFAAVTTPNLFTFGSQSASVFGRPATTQSGFQFSAGTRPSSGLAKPMVECSLSLEEFKELSQKMNERFQKFNKQIQKRIEFNQIPASTVPSTSTVNFGGSSNTLTTAPAFRFMTTSAGFSGKTMTKSIFAPTSSASVLQPPSSTTQSFFGNAASQPTFTANTTGEAKSTFSTFSFGQNTTANTIPQFGSSGSIMSGTSAGSGFAVTPATTPVSTSTFAAVTTPNLFTFGSQSASVFGRPATTQATTTTTATAAPPAIGFSGFGTTPRPTFQPPQLSNSSTPAFGAAPSNRFAPSTTPSFQFGSGQANAGVFTFIGNQENAEPEPATPFQFNQQPATTQSGFQFSAGTKPSSGLAKPMVECSFSLEEFKKLSQKMVKRFQKLKEQIQKRKEFNQIPASTVPSTSTVNFGGSSNTLTTAPAYGMMTTSGGVSGTTTTNSIFAPTSSASVLQPPSSTTQSFFGNAATQPSFTANTTAEAKSTFSTFSFGRNTTANTIPQFGSSGSIMSGTSAGSGIAVMPAPTPASTSTFAAVTTPNLFTFGSQSASVFGRLATSQSGFQFSAGTQPSSGAAKPILSESASVFWQPATTQATTTATVAPPPRISGFGTTPRPTFPSPRLSSSFTPAFGAAPSFQFGSGQFNAGILTFTGNQENVDPEPATPFQFNQQPATTQSGIQFSAGTQPNFNFGANTLNPTPNPTPNQFGIAGNQKHFNMSASSAKVNNNANLQLLRRAARRRK